MPDAALHRVCAWLASCMLISCRSGQTVLGWPDMTRGAIVPCLGRHLGLCAGTAQPAQVNGLAVLGWHDPSNVGRPVWPPLLQTRRRLTRAGEVGGGAGLGFKSEEVAIIIGKDK